MNFLKYQDQIVSFKLITCIGSFKVRMKQSSTDIGYIVAWVYRT